MAIHHWCAFCWTLYQESVGEDTGTKMLHYYRTARQALDYALPLPADLPPDTDAYPECWLSVQDLQCAGAGGALDVSLTVRAEGAVLARQTASLVGAVELGDPLAPADPEVSLRICYAQPGEELFAIARRYHVSPGQMLAANDLPDGTARLDEAQRLLVPGG